MVARVPVSLLAQRPLALLVSGGLDSMVLLRLAARLNQDGLLRVAPVVYHLEHGLRSEGAGDLDFVRREVAALGWPFFFERKDTAAFARRLGLGAEEAGRVLRYRGVGRLLRSMEGAAAVTAHHADDYLESVLLHLLRGGGRSAFDTLPVSARVQGIPVLRPLLSVSREELAGVAAAHEIRYREDASNSDTNFRRNRLRAQLVPVLKREGLDVGAFWRRFHGESAAEAIALAGVPPTHVSLDRRLLFPGTGRQVKRALDVALGSLGLSPASESLAAALLAAFHTRADFRFRWNSAHLLAWANRSGPLWLFAGDGLLKPPQFSQEPGRAVIRYGGRTTAYALSAGEAASAWKPGLKVSLPGGGRKELKKVFQELGLPVPLRRLLPLIINEREGLVSRVCLSFWENTPDRVFAAREAPGNEQF